MSVSDGSNSDGDSDSGPGITAGLQTTQNHCRGERGEGEEYFFITSQVSGATVTVYSWSIG